ncbi:MAG: NAD(+) diphosphatase [Rhodobacteraceae bacterium]|nr:MAG: NAD(+) diphosphatase [Paracoccaceae bacterium]
MKQAEEVTFGGGGGLDRAAHLRGDPAALDALKPRARAIVLWRGKPLVEGEARDRLALLPLDHPVIRAEVGTRDAVVFLGLDPDGRALFAVDLSTWEPEQFDAESLGLFLDPSIQRHPALPETQVFAELRGLMVGLSRLDAECAATAKAVIGWHQTHGHCARCGAGTDLVQAGWQRTCPACRSHHFPRTDPVVIMLITHGSSVLMGRSPGWPEGMYSLLAGFIEPGETLEAAVRREVFEETGVRVGAVEYLSSQPWPFPASLMFGCRGEALSREIRIDPAEIEDAMWVSRSDMMEAFAGRHPVLKPARKGAIAHFLIRNWLADRLD